MSDRDAFALLLLEEAKRFLEKAEEVKGTDGEAAFLHASLMIAFGSLEAHVNEIADDFVTRPDISDLDRSVLMEKEIRLNYGEFELGQLKIHRLEDRILFLHKRFSGKALDRTASYWSQLTSAMKLRNALTHPKQVLSIGADDVRRAIVAIVTVINVLFQAIYDRPFPAANRGLQSRLTF